MPEYLHPGVYIQEESSGAKPIEGASTSTAAFVGLASRGRPNSPTFISSWPQFVRTFGDLDKSSPMSLAVYQFFQNGGKRAYVLRVLSSSAVTATSDITTVPLGKNKDGTTVSGPLTVGAAGKGEWGNSISVYWRADQRIVYEDPADQSKRVVATTYRWEVRIAGTVVESWSGLGASEDDERFYAAVINRDSQCIQIAPNAPSLSPDAPSTLNWDAGTQLGTKVKGSDTGSTASSGAASGGTGGDAGTVTPALPPKDWQDALASLDPIDDASILVIPGAPFAVAEEGLAYVNKRPLKDLFYIVDFDHTNYTENQPAVQQAAAFAAKLTKSDHAALYFPWVTISDPFTKLENVTRVVPPSGMIAGLYARTDNTRGVWKAPAGVEATLSGVLGVEADLTDTDQDMLNPIGVNCIRNFPAAGTVVWGARTLATQSNPEYRYVSVRRTAMFLEKSLYRGTQWVVFEPNDEPLWSSIRFNLNGFMLSLFRAGAFQGGKPSDAYIVRCDGDNNIQATIDAGQVHILVAFAPLKPAEFVIIHITQVRKS